MITMMLTRAMLAMVIVHDHDGDDDDAGDHADDDDARDDAAQQGQWALMIRIRAVRSPTGRCAQQGAKAARGCDAYRRSKRCRGTGRHAPHPSILLQPPFHQIIHPSIHWNRCYVSDGVEGHELGVFLSRLHCSRPGLSYIALHQYITKSRLLQGAAPPRLPFHCLFPQRRQPFFLQDRQFTVGCIAWRHPIRKNSGASLLCRCALLPQLVSLAVVEAEDAMYWAPRLKPKCGCISFRGLDGGEQIEECFLSAYGGVFLQQELMRASAGHHQV